MSGAVIDGVISLDAVNTAVRTILRTILGLTEGTIRPANQNAPTGETLWGTVLVSPLGGNGWDVRAYADDETEGSTDVIESISGQRNFTASVQFYKTGANATASRIEAVIQSSSALTLMSQLGVYFVKVGGVRNLSQVVNTLWEDRAQLDIECCCSVLETSELSSITSAPLTLDIQH